MMAAEDIADYNKKNINDVWIVNMTIQEISTRKEDQTFDCKSIEDNSTFSRHAKVGVNSTLVIWLIENVQ